MELAGGHSITVSLSIGIAAFPEHAQTADELLKCADVAMYEAKRVARGHHRMARHTASM
jgi:diguanylate cyclase (GGDEF)-like protein